MTTKETTSARRREQSSPSLMWTYKGVDVFRADRNSSGIRWYARDPRAEAVLRSDTKESMRHLISELPEAIVERSK